MSGSNPYPLEPTAEEMRAMGHATVGAIERFIDGLPFAGAADLDGAFELAGELRERAPEEGMPFEQVLDRVVMASQKAVNNSGPGFMAYIPGGGLYTSALADLLAGGFNRYVTFAGMAPALAQIESTVLRWLCDIFDFPQAARGVLTSGGSMANFSAVVAARQAKLGEGLAEGMLYTSQESHASCAKAGYLAGFSKAQVRLVPTDDALAMDADAFAAMVAEDRAAGRRPFMVTATAGTTNTGAIDPIARIGEVARANDMWLHVDAAYGGPFCLTPYGRALFAGIDRADSITLDPHKAFFLPYGIGALLVRNGTQLHDAHHVPAGYLQDLDLEEDLVPNMSEYSMELSRSFRGLKLWLPVQLHGMAAFRSALEEKLELARYIYDEIRDAPGFEVPLKPALTAMAFRYIPSSGDVNAFNQRLLDRINASDRIFLSSTTIRDQFMIRTCVVSHRTHHDRVEEAVRVVKAAARDLAGRPA